MSLNFVQSPNSFSLLRRSQKTHHSLPNGTSSACRYRPRISTNASNSKDFRNRNNHDNEEDEDPELSRRVFLAGIAATTTATTLAGYRFIVGEDVESRIRLRLSQRFPSLFPHETTPEQRRGSLNTSFAGKYFNAIRTVSSDMHILPDKELLAEEEVMRQRAFPLFFDGEPKNRSVGDPAWLNFLLYARLHVIATRTSPLQRVEFSTRLAQSTIPNFRSRPLRLAEEDVRLQSGKWLGTVRSLLQELVGLGWISGFRVEEFDGEPGSLWQDERRSTLTVYSFDPVTMQAAQLIGEEQFEEISPKVSGWITAFLKGSGISKVTYEDYYLDDAYRPDPEQFKPTQLATQFDLAL